ncbi:hypothetical protein SAMN04489707_102348 [Paenacidovorax caeni]|uniref:Prophage tail length tape measure protein n=1 Tax=Paenacidovorax caeni TaxID=343013 RepID=A0A1I7J8R4_9BURK|nr:hypothetical protein [Paenacidovorax caeni]SFU81606.1 hypothetical protein SAMN04489707_102348 [Paenacidovorax caeni]
MSALGSLIVKLGLEYAEYTSGLSKTEQAALATAKKVQDTFDGLQQKVATTVGAIAGGLAAGFAVSAFKNLLAGVIETGARLDDLRMQTGETVEALSALLAVGKYNDVGADQLGAMMQKLSSNLAGATEESKGASKALQALGIDMEAFRRQSPAEQFQEIARKLADFEDGAGKSAVAIALLGKEGANALPFFNDLASVGELQAKVTEGQAAAAANLDDNLVRLSTTGDAWKKELVTGMVPALDDAAQALLDVTNGTGGIRDEVRKLVADGSIREWTSSAIEGLSYVMDVGAGVVRTFQTVGKFLGATAAAMSAWSSGDMQAVAQIRAELVSDLDQMWTSESNGQRFRARLEEVSKAKDESLRSYAAQVQQTLAAYAGYDESIQRAAMKSLKEAYFGEEKKSLDGFTNVVEKAGKAAAAAKNPVDALIESIDKRAAHLALELAAEEKLTEGEKAAIDVLEQLRSGKVKVTEAESALIGERLKSMLEQEKAVKRMAEEKQALEALRVERVKVVQGMEQSAAAVLQSNEELEREIELIGLTQAQQADVLRARNEAIILTKEATLAELERRDAITGTMSREQIALAQEIDGLKRRNELLGKKQAREEEFTAWQSMWQSIDQTAHDVFVNVFEDGAGTFKRLGQTLKAAVLDLLYQMTIKRWIISIGASVFGAGTAAAASAGGGALSTMGSAGGILSGVGAIGGAFAGGMGWLTGATTLGGALSAGGSLIAAGGAGVLPGMGMIGGALAPIALGLVALYSLYSSLDRSGTPHWGAAAEYDGTTLTGGNDVFRRSGTAGTYSAQAQAGVDAVAKGVGDTLNGLARAFGQDGGYNVMTAYSDDSSDDPGFGSLRITRAGEKVRDWEDDRTSKWAPGIFADGEEGWKLYLSAIAKDTRQALLDMDIPGWAEKMLTGLGDSVTMEQLAATVQQIGAINNAFDLLGQQFDWFATMTDDARAALMDFSGGIDALVANAATYYQNFYSPEEQRATVQRQLSEALGQLDLLLPDIDASDARAQWRALVEAQDTSTEAGQRARAMLLQLSGAFASITNASEAATEAAKADANARRAATDAALQALERAVAAERTAIQARVTAAQERVAQERAIVELTQGHVRELRGQVDTTAAMAVAQAKRFIDDAVGAAGNSGYLPDQAELSRAIDTMRGGMGQESYSSRLAWEEAQLKLALQLETLGESAKDQLTTDEQTLAAAEEQLRYLDDLLTAARVEIDAIRGTTKAVESVTTAIDALREAILEEKRKEEEAKKPGSGGSSGGGGFAIGGSGPGDGGGGGGIYVPPTKSEAIRSQFRGYDPQSTEDLLKAYNASLYFDWTTKDIADAYGVGEEDMRALFEEHGIPAFARGGTHAGGLRLVGEEGPELEVTGAARIYSAGQTRDMLSQLAGGGSSAEMARAVERLALAVESQGSRLGDIGQHTRDTADVLMRVTRGGQAMQNANASKTLELRV